MATRNDQTAADMVDLAGCFFLVLWFMSILLGLSLASVIIWGLVRAVLHYT